LNGAGTLLGGRFRLDSSGLSLRRISWTVSVGSGVVREAQSKAGTFTWTLVERQASSVGGGDALCDGES
jgi:hypothetical protein